jgi:hypothetical protein
MELTFPKGALDKQTCADIDAFYGGIFGWQSNEIEVRGAPCYLLMANEGHALLLGESATPMQALGDDHLGLNYQYRSEVDDLLEQCRRYREKDDRVEIKEYEDLITTKEKSAEMSSGSTPAGGQVVHAFKVKYLLPIQFDVHCYEYPSGAEPEHRWQYV